METKASQSWFATASRDVVSRFKGRHMARPTPSAPRRRTGLGKVSEAMAGALSEQLIPKLLARFPDRCLRIYQGKQPFATFPASHPEVGDLQIHDDGDELTISIGR
jgi:hypothetical protein